MVNAEIDSFVVKFKSLWAAGYKATLSLESCMGEVVINLNCKVGRNEPPTTPSPSYAMAASRTYRSPSYYRRQARRRAEHVSINETKPKEASTPVAEKTEEFNSSSSEVDVSAMAVQAKDVTNNVHAEEVSEMVADDVDLLEKSCDIDKTVEVQHTRGNSSEYSLLTNFDAMNTNGNDIKDEKNYAENPSALDRLVMLTNRIDAFSNLYTFR